ncbi:pheromone A receptor-domain-containing protein [Mycena galopus ATCC 62051]|nr:pheromone A receptor-domain-containing protein [Mycena galopus ATCC 62051]
MLAPTDPSYPAFPILSFLGFILALVPLPWHFQPWNSGTYLFSMWTALSCLNGFINSIVWANSVEDVAPVWCDISTKLMIGIGVGIPASSLCINRRLYKIACCKTFSVSRSERHRTVFVDLAIGLGIPLLQMPLQFVVQGHRYDILENIGCYPTTYNVVPAYPLSLLWPSIINLFTRSVSAISGLTTTRYFRLMALASLELLISLPVVSYELYLTVSRAAIQPWVSWDNTHTDFYLIEQVPAIVWRADGHTEATYELSRWVGVLCALAFFAFFGFATEAKKHYWLAFSAVAACWVQIKSASHSAVSCQTATMHTENSGKSMYISPPLLPVNLRTEDSWDKSTAECDTYLPGQTYHNHEYVVPFPPAMAAVEGPPL